MFGYRVQEILSLLPPEVSLAGEKAATREEERLPLVSRDGVVTLRGNEISRMITAYKALNFGWLVAFELATKRLRLPQGMNRFLDEAVYRAYNYLLGHGHDPEVAFAIGLGWDARTEPERNILNALLVCRDYDRDWVARQFAISPKTLWLYEQLFFNVIDRRSEGLWYVAQFFPNTKIEEHLADYIKNENIGKILIRAGVQNGMADVLSIAGSPLGREKLRLMALSETREKLEQEIMQQGLLFAKNGWLGQRENATALQRAQSLMSAGKVGGSEASEGERMLDGGFSEMIYQSLKTTKKAEAEVQQRVLVGATGGRN